MHLGAELWGQTVTAIWAPRNEDSVCSLDRGGLMWVGLGEDGVGMEGEGGRRRGCRLDTDGGEKC